MSSKSLALVGDFDESLFLAGRCIPAHCSRDGSLTAIESSLLSRDDTLLHLLYEVDPMPEQHFASST